MPTSKTAETPLSRTSFSWSAKLRPGFNISESPPIAPFRNGHRSVIRFSVANAPTTGRLFISVRKDAPGNLSPWLNVASSGVNPDGQGSLEVEPPHYYGESDAGPEVAYLRASFAPGNYDLERGDEPPTVRLSVDYAEVAE